MIWLLENELFDNLDELKGEITRQGHQYISGRYPGFGAAIEWEGNFDFLEAIEETDEKFFIYGSLPFVKRLKCADVYAWCNLPQLKCSYYYPRLSKYLLNRECAFLPFGQLADASEWIFKTFGSNNETRIFMRPDSGFKQFTGQCYDLEYWDGFLRLSNIALQPEDLVLISNPKEIFKEYRVIIGPSNNNERQIPITVSRTHTLGKVDEAVCGLYETCDVLDFVYTVLDDICYEPDPMWVMDVCRDAYGELKVLEVNSMSCSGYYKCSMEAIVKAVADYIEAT